jgi:ribosomal protein S18 acetylase RimI-like enzyme
MFQVPNIESISLEVSVLNEAAIQLYLKHGFKVVSLRKAYYDGVDAYLMVKDMVV